MVGIAISALFAKYLVKVGFGAISGDGASIGALLKAQLPDLTSGAAPLVLKEALDRAKIRGAERRELMNACTVLDLAGVAWVEQLNLLPDNAFRVYTNLSALETARVLDRRWFTSTVIQDGQTAHGRIAALGDPGTSDDALAEALAPVIVRAIREEFPTEEPTAGLEDLVLGILKRLPDEISRLCESLPGLREKHQLDIAKATYGIVSGANSNAEIDTAFRDIAQQLVGSLSRDVFGREQSGPNELALLPLEETYIEPNAQEFNSAKPSLLPVKQLIQSLFQKRPDQRLVVLQAPFGFGKSLTFKSLAADLAKEYLGAPNSARMPLLLRCPEILSGHVSSLRAAVVRWLETHAKLDGRAAERVLQSQQLFLLLDSFDEVKMNAKDARSWIEDMQQLASPRVRILVASRPHAFESRWLESVDREVEIMPFDAAC